MRAHVAHALAMEETERDSGGRRMDEQSGLRLLAEIGRLLLVLAGRVAAGAGRLLWRGLRLVLKWACRGLLALIDVSERGWTRAAAFWNDNGTQEKLRKARRAAWSALCASGRGARAASVWAARGLAWLAVRAWAALVWLLVAAARALVHLGPTLVAAGRGLARGARAARAGMRRAGRSVAAWRARRRAAWRRFRRNAGFRGLLVDVGVWLKGEVDSYMDEEQDEAQGDVLTDAELLDAQLGGRPGAEGRRALGGRVYDWMRRIVEE